MEYDQLMEIINNFREKPNQLDYTSEHCLEILRLLNKYKEGAFDKNNLNGHITAGGLVVCDSFVLLNHHKKLNKWLGFGGHAESGETDPFLTACREVKEESGIAGLKSNGKIFDIDKFIFKHDENPAHTHYDIRYLFVANQKTCNVSQESHSLNWFHIDTAINMVSDSATRRMLIKYKTLYDNKRKNTPTEEIVK